MEPVAVSGKKLSDGGRVEGLGSFRRLADVFQAVLSERGLDAVLDKIAEALSDLIPDLLTMSPEQLAQLPGVSASRSHQVVAGALVAEAVMDIFDLPELEICPWALREGIILERLDQIGVRPGR